MWKWIRKQLLKVPVLNDWLMRREYVRDMKALHKRFDPLIGKARKAKDSKALNDLDSEYYGEYVCIRDPYTEWQSDQIVRKARKFWIDIAPYPAQDADDDETWQRNTTSYEWVLTHAASQRIRKDIRDEQRAANDEKRKWATLFFAIVGSALATWSLLIKTKQPDPCQRNYYRNDSGACVFAFQPPSPVTVQTPQPLPKAVHP
jgi:hypothetical protein